MVSFAPVAFKIFSDVHCPGSQVCSPASGPVGSSPLPSWILLILLKGYSILPLSPFLPPISYWSTPTQGLTPAVHTLDSCAPFENNRLLFSPHPISSYLLQVIPLVILLHIQNWLKPSDGLSTSSSPVYSDRFLLLIFFCHLSFFIFFPSCLGSSSGIPNFFLSTPSLMKCFFCKKKWGVLILFSPFWFPLLCPQFFPFHNTLSPPTPPHTLSLSATPRFFVILGCFCHFNHIQHSFSSSISPPWFSSSSFQLSSTCSLGHILFSPTVLNPSPPVSPLNPSSKLYWFLFCPPWPHCFWKLMVWQCMCETRFFFRCLSCPDRTQKKVQTSSQDCFALSPPSFFSLSSLPRFVLLLFSSTLLPITSLPLFALGQSVPLFPPSVITGLQLPIGPLCIFPLPCSFPSLFIAGPPNQTFFFWHWGYYSLNRTRLFWCPILGQPFPPNGIIIFLSPWPFEISSIAAPLSVPSLPTLLSTYLRIFDNWNFTLWGRLLWESLMISPR